MVYAVDEWGDREHQGATGSISAFTICPEDHSLSLSSTASTSGNWPCHGLLLQPSNRLVLANYGGANVCSIPILEGGDLDTEVTNHQIISFEDLPGSSNGPNPGRQDQSHPHGVHLDPTGEFIIVPDLGTDELRIVRIVDQTTGQLELMRGFKVAAGDGPRHALFTTSPEGEELLYVLNELSNSISLYSVAYNALPTSPTTSPLSPDFPDYPTARISFKIIQSTTSTLPSQPFAHQPDFSTWHAAELVLSPSNSALCVSNRAEDTDPLLASPIGPHDIFAVFKLSEDGLFTGQHKFLDTGGRTPRFFCMSPPMKFPSIPSANPASEYIEQSEGEEEDGEEIEEGRWMVTVLQDSDEIVIHKREEMKIVARLREAGKPAVVVWL